MNFQGLSADSPRPHGGGGGDGPLRLRRPQAPRRERWPIEMRAAPGLAAAAAAHGGAGGPRHHGGGNGPWRYGRPQDCI